MTSVPIETLGNRGARTYTGTTGANPLVVSVPTGPAAGVVLGDNPFSGLRLIDDANQIANAIESKDWVSGGLATVGAGFDVAMAITNPIATLVSMGVGWAIDHIEPLKGWFDQLTGDPAQVGAAAATWHNISVATSQSAQQLQDSLNHLDGQSGATVNAYRQMVTDLAAHINAAAGLASATSTGLQVAAVIVQFVHDLVRDAISDCVGFVVQSLVEIACTVGLGLVDVIPQLCELVAKWARRLASDIEDLIKSVGKLANLFKDSDNLLTALRRVLNQIRPGHNTLETTGTTHQPRLEAPLDNPKAPLVNGPYIRNGEPYGRPELSGKARLEFEQKVYDAQVGVDGILREPYPPYAVIDWTPGAPRLDKVDFGHIQGYNYSDMFAQYRDGEITLAQLKEFQFNPANYRLELPGPNRSHTHE